MVVQSQKVAATRKCSRSTKTLLTAPKPGLPCVPTKRITDGWAERKTLKYFRIQ